VYWIDETNKRIDATNNRIDQLTFQVGKIAQEMERIKREESVTSDILTRLRALERPLLYNTFLNK